MTTTMTTRTTVYAMFASIFLCACMQQKSNDENGFRTNGNESGRISKVEKEVICGIYIRTHKCVENRNRSNKKKRVEHEQWENERATMRNARVILTGKVRNWRKLDSMFRWNSHYTRECKHAKNTITVHMSHVYTINPTTFTICL